MDKQEVKDEYKQAELPAEVRGAIRRRQMMASRARMMAAVPDADVVVTNPTHYAVALRYSAELAAPEVVAKGMDLVAFKIREIAKDAGVPVIPDPPLARALHAAVEVGDHIPEELYEAVAQCSPSSNRTAKPEGGGMNEAMKKLSKYTDMIAAIFVVIVIVMMIVPLPPIIIDLLIAANISMALAIVIMTLYVRRALDFSVFPSLLLLTTLLRLAINVSVTRLILLHGDAGHMVKGSATSSSVATWSSA